MENLSVFIYVQNIVRKNKSVKREVDMSVAEMILAFFFPPISVLLRYGLTGKFWLNLLLTLVGWFPGVVHAFVVLGKKEHSVTTKA